MVVVLPTPPFWLHIETTRAVPCSLTGGGSGRNGIGRPVGPSSTTGSWTGGAEGAEGAEGGSGAEALSKGSIEASWGPCPAAADEAGDGITTRGGICGAPDAPAAPEAVVGLGGIPSLMTCLLLFRWPAAD